MTGSWLKIMIKGVGSSGAKERMGSSLLSLPFSPLSPSLPLSLLFLAMHLPAGYRQAQETWPWTFPQQNNPPNTLLLAVDCRASASCYSSTKQTEVQRMKRKEGGKRREDRVWIHFRNVFKGPGSTFGLRALLSGTHWIFKHH